MPPIRDVMKGLVKAIKSKARRKAKNPAPIPSPQASAPPVTVSKPPLATPLLEKPAYTVVHVDTIGNTIIRIKVAEKNYQAICDLLISQGELVKEIKKIFLFYSFGSPIRLLYDDSENTFWDIQVHTQDKDKQKALLDMLDSKKELFNLTTRSTSKITPAPKLHTEKKGSAPKAVPVKPTPSKPKAPPAAQATKPAAKAEIPPPPKPEAAKKPIPPPPQAVKKEQPAATAAPAVAKPVEKAATPPPPPEPPKKAPPEPPEAIKKEPAPVVTVEIKNEPDVARVETPGLQPGLPKAPVEAAKPDEKTTASIPVEVTLSAAEQEKREREAILRERYNEYADLIKKLFPEGSVMVTVKDKEEEVQLSFNNNAVLCDVARKNLEDYKKQGKQDMGNHLTLPRSSKLTQMLFNDDRIEMWKEAFKKGAATVTKTAKVAKPAITQKHPKIPDHPTEATTPSAPKATVTDKLHLKKKTDPNSAQE